MNVYGKYDQEALDIQYSPSSKVDDIKPFLTEYAVRSRRTREELAVRRGIPYGPEACETLDFFPADGPGAPLLVFVHGGYWQELSKDDSAFPAPGAVAAGAAFAALGYGLAPQYSLEQIVGQARRGLAWLVQHADELGVDRRRIHLAGHCAGAHLVLSALLDDWRPDGRHPADVFAGAVLVSGVYDLEPLRLTYVNKPLGLTEVTARRLSPLHHLPDRLPPLVVARGGAETDEFCRQHGDAVEALGRRSPGIRDLVVHHRNHFDITFDLTDPATALGASVLRPLRAGAPDSGPAGPAGPARTTT
ncbi:alpha/beta hydrolase [Kitasatospora sp. NPDC015120]|uniref:alpha/beta hydrolase n=1 Tax=Kitasatospora sp. NPDC015120 TaxID=3364023 RepID=UPI0036F48206